MILTCWFLHLQIPDNSIFKDVSKYLTEGLAAKHLCHYRKLKIELLYRSVRRITNMKLTIPIFHPQPPPRLRPAGVPQYVAEVNPPYQGSINSDFDKNQNLGCI